MRKDVILVTGAGGEMGQALIRKLWEAGRTNILALDVNPLPDGVRTHCQVAVAGDILDAKLLARLVSEYAMPVVFHLAALLSTRAEFTPEAAHQVNVDGTLGLLRMAVEQADWLGQKVKFIFPSSIAVYGMPDLAAKDKAGAVREDEWLVPTTMYGANKLYCEHLGRYYAHHYRQLAIDPHLHTVDFRAIRFPGLISAFTLPTGGTSDFAPEMVHRAAEGQPYRCFVRESTRIPFMTMSDAIKALLDLEAAPRERLTRDVYNVTSFSPTAGQIRDRVRAAFPEAAISFAPDEKRQAIVDSWPVDQDDSAARRDWGWTPEFDQDRAFNEYLIPRIRKRYAGGRA